MILFLSLIHRSLVAQCLLTKRDVNFKSASKRHLAWLLISPCLCISVNGDKKPCIIVLFQYNESVLTKWKICTHQITELSVIRIQILRHEHSLLSIKHQYDVCLEDKADVLKFLTQTQTYSDLLGVSDFQGGQYQMITRPSNWPWM